MVSLIKTTVLILSDTHGLQFAADKKPLVSADVAIHCGDLTEDSKLQGFKEAIQLLKEAFKDKIAEASRLVQEDLEQTINDEYGDYGEASGLFLEARDHGIIFLEEGSHEILLENGASMRLYASPYTPVTRGSTDWGFQYNGFHEFAIQKGFDVVVTHGPPHGIMDMTTDKQRIGCTQLFAAVARAQPQLHCFGHVHNGWGAKVVSWRPQISDKPSHFSDIDNAKSMVIESLLHLKGTKWETTEDKEKRKANLSRYMSQRCCFTSHCAGDERPLAQGETLFVNASLMGDEGLTHHPWLVDIELGHRQDDADLADGSSTNPCGSAERKGSSSMSSGDALINFPGGTNSEVGGGEGPPWVGKVNLTVGAAGSWILICLFVLLLVVVAGFIFILSGVAWRWV
ncbi:metallophosphoesterase domain protein [Fusarium beomiforme]|uniref:Metallophosphoesterase domain protein n=1 Tax=Fusarium beomiforme TaxID=44412 RepID=A0A9P5AML5_9HYPO|nr:metallophosphoesterase domain protein [Fusarium beomiforme]